MIICLVFLVTCFEKNTFAQDKATEAAALSEQQKKEKTLEHARRGQAFLKRKYWKDAASEFEKAIELQPDNSVLHHLLGVSYLENSQAGKGWIQLRKAVQLDPANKRAAQDFMRIWNFFDSKGYLNVGTPEVEVLKTLGKPDQQKDQAGNSRLIYGFMWVNFRNGRLFALLDTRGLKTDLTRAVNTMEFELSPAWKVGYRTMNATNALTEYVTAEETVQNYKQLFSTQRLFKLGEQISARDMMNRMKATLEKTHQIEEWKVLRDSDDDILFEWSVAKQKQTPSQHEISRVIKGKRDMHRLAFVTRNSQLSEENRSKWIKEIEAAKLIVAHPESINLSTVQKKNLADQLTKKSREIIALQLKYIQKQDVESMKPFFTERVRPLITADALEKAKQQAASATPEALVHSIQIIESGTQIHAKIKMKNGRTLTTLVPVNGKWEADTIWFK